MTDNAFGGHEPPQPQERGALSIGAMPVDTSDAALVRTLPGFEEGFAVVNGIRIHYVAGGEGPPLVLLPGHPETWWAYHAIMPRLGLHFRVIAVDLRGMGASDKPLDGYDKRTMALDVHGLVLSLGFERVNIAGHDVGAMVAFSFAANHPDATIKLAMLDVAHPDESFHDIRMLPREGAFGAKIDAAHPVYTWWFAFHQVTGLPEQLLDGDGMRRYISWLFGYMLEDENKIQPIDLAVYGDAYSSPDAIRAGHAWYRAFPKDIEDQKSYPILRIPVLGLGGEHTGYRWLQVVASKAADFRLVKVPNSGHFLVMEQPEFVFEQLADFFQ